ncbi:MAG: hydroxymethylglutaryl-CoA reductase [Bacteroidota bacterium]
MSSPEMIRGFSKLDRKNKVKKISEWIQDDELEEFLHSFRLDDAPAQQTFEKFSENTLSNYHLPWGIVPNVLIDGNLFHVPVVIEESSVVAAASKAASFWALRGGFQTVFINTIKKGQLHFTFRGDKNQLLEEWESIASLIKEKTSSITRNMEKRGGGIKAMHLRKLPQLSENYYQIDIEADTADSMGANFINSVLEQIGRTLPEVINVIIPNSKVDVLMAILSNYTPDSIVKMKVEAPVEKMTWYKDMSAGDFVRRMRWAADIAWHDVSRAVTHNKGIFNGIDAVVLSTGNDFRAVEASGHAFASHTGQYRALSRVEIKDDIFSLKTEVPMALGTVGGLTKLHPLACKTLQILKNPDAKTLMKIATAVGLANNFAAMASLVTTGIQQGHMKMHLHNIIQSLNIDPSLIPAIEEHFKGKTISVSAVREFIE